MSEFLPRVICYSLLLLILIPHSAIPIVPYKILVAVFPRIHVWITRLRLTVEWSLFTTIGNRYHDIRIAVTTSDGIHEDWYLLESKMIGKIAMTSAQTRVTLTFYFEQYRFLIDSIERELGRYFAEQGRTIRSWHIEFLVFESSHSQRLSARELEPVSRRVIHAKDFV
jgi:hypothetical protein